MDLRPEFRVVIAGSRSFIDLPVMRKKCDSILDKKSRTHCIVVLSGKMYGADETGEEYAKERGFEIRDFWADWDRFGNAAGPIRNQKMLDNADAVIVFWDGRSPGSKNMITISRAKGVPLRVIRFQA